MTPSERNYHRNRKLSFWEVIFLGIIGALLGILIVDWKLFLNIVVAIIALPILFGPLLIALKPK